MGFPVYRVGDDGSVWRWINGSCGKLHRRGWRKLKGTQEKRTYLAVNLKYKHKIQRVLIHSLVLIAFTGPRPIGMFCCHNDGNKFNNNLDNLRWDTPLSNQRDRISHGTYLCGQQIKTSVLIESQVYELRKSYSQGNWISKAACARHYSAKFGINFGTLCNILKNKDRWPHVVV